MTVENRIPSLSKTHQVLEYLAQKVRELSDRSGANRDGSQGDLSGAIQVIQEGLDTLDRGMLEAQRQMKEEFDILLARSGEAYVVLDRAGRYEDVNQVAEREIFRRPAADIIGHTFEELPPGIDLEEFKRQFSCAVNENRQIHFIAASPVNGRTYEIRGYPREAIVELLISDRSANTKMASERERVLVNNRQQKELLEAVLQQMPAGVLIVDAATKEVIIQNRQIAEILQQPQINLLSLDWEGCSLGYHLDGKPLKKEEWPLYRSLYQGEIVENEEIQIGASGDEHYISANAAPIFGPEGKIDAAVTILFDITERRRNELNNHFLAQLGEQLIRLVEVQEIRTYATRAVGEYLNAARCTLDELNLKEQHVIIEQDYTRSGSSLAGLYPFSPLHEQFASAFAQGMAQTVENTALDPLTAPFFDPILRDQGILSFVAVPRYRNDQWVSTLMVMDDRPRRWRPDEISLLRSSADLIWMALESAKLVKDLEMTTTRFNVALKNAPIMVHSLDRNLRYRWVYKAPANFNTDEVIGKRFDELVPPEDVRELMELKQSVLESGVSTRQEVHTHLDGEDQILDVTLEPLHDAWGAVIGLTVAAIDITGQRRLEAEVIDRMTQIEIQHEILRHREMERMEIARDLHDGPLQELIGLNFAINEIGMIDDDDERAKAIQETQEMLQRQIQDLRAFCYELRPPALTPFGFERAVRSHLEQFGRKYPHLQIHADLMHDAKTLPEDVRMALFRAYQEALNNVARHSEASEVWITFRFDERQAELEIRDNGKGFKVPKQWLQLAREGHLGMVGMHERVEAAGGTVVINTAPNHGTQVKVTVPIPETQPQVS